MVREEGLMDPPIRYIPTVVSPVPEEEEEDNEDGDASDDGDGAQKKDDFSVQEVVENEPTLLRPPPTRTSCSSRSWPGSRSHLSAGIQIFSSILFPRIKHKIIFKSNSVH